MPSRFLISGRMTWGNGSIPNKDTDIADYNISGVTERGSGGYICEIISCGIMFFNYHYPPKCEVLVIDVAISQNKLLVALPDAVCTICKYVKPFLSSELVILGDFNLDWLTPASDHFNNICLDFNQAQLSLLPLLFATSSI